MVFFWYNHLMSFFQKSKYGKRSVRKLVIISAQLSVCPLNMGVTPPPPTPPLPRPGTGTCWSFMLMYALSRLAEMKKNVFKNVWNEIPSFLQKGPITDDKVTIYRNYVVLHSLSGVIKEAAVCVHNLWRKNRLRCTVDYKNRTSLLFITYEGIHKTTFGKNLIFLFKKHL